MKTSKAHREGTIWQGILKGIVLAVAATAVLAVIFALVISLFEITDSLIHTINQVIKLVAVFIGVRAAVKPGSERGLLRGAAVGFFYMAVGVLVYALLTGQRASWTAYAADVLMGVAAGGLFGLWRARI